MHHVITSDARIAYEVLGSGPAVVLLHPFPVSHQFWHTAITAGELDQRYQLILPDMRGHGSSEPGDGPATMVKHASDIARVCNDAGIGRAIFVGCSIGGYALFEFWRCFRDRVQALVLCNTKAQADGAEAKAGRRKVAEDVLLHGTGPFLDTMIPRLLGETTRRNRPDRVAAARTLMERMSPAALSAVQLGMADRPDSVALLKTITVPTLLLTGAEDILTGAADAERMRNQIPGSQLSIIPRAGHYAPFEQPEAVGMELRRFLDGQS